MKLILAVLLFINSVWAALPATAVWEVHSLAAAGGSGCFSGSGTDRSNSDSIFQAYTDLVRVSATTISSAAHPFAATDIGNCINVTSGTGWTTGIYHISNVVSAVATVDRTIASVGSTGGNANLGGALNTLAALAAAMVNGNIAWVKADGAYSVAAKVTFSFSAVTLQTQINGYTASHTDNGVVTVSASASINDRIIDLNSTAASFWFRNFLIDVNGQTVTSCLDLLKANTFAENIECKGPTRSTPAITLTTASQMCRNCYVHNGTNTGNSPGFFLLAGGVCVNCTVATMAGKQAFSITQGECYYCTAFGYAQAGSDAFFLDTTPGPVVIDHCVVYSVTRDGINISGANIPITITNCIFDTVTTGINNTSGTTLRTGDIFSDYNFIFSGTLVSGLTAGVHSVTLSADPFTSPGTGNFTLNNTSGGGASVRTAGYSPTLPGVTGTSFPDGGVMQTQSTVTSTGGSVVLP